jgi:hypothetical protein
MSARDIVKKLREEARHVWDTRTHAANALERLTEQLTIVQGEVARLTADLSAETYLSNTLSKERDNWYNACRLACADVNDNGFLFNNLDDLCRTYYDKAVPEKTLVDSVREGVEHIVSIMNSGKVNPKDVYPSGRYSGD